MSTYQIQILPRSNVVGKTSYRDRYFFIPSISGIAFVEKGFNEEGIYELQGSGGFKIEFDCLSSTFPKIRVGSGGIKLSGTGFELGTQFFNLLTSTDLDVTTRIPLKSPSLIETSPVSKYFFKLGSAGYFITQESNGGEWLGSGGIKLDFNCVEFTFPKIRVGSGGIKLSGSGSLGTCFYDDLNASTSLRPFIHIVLSNYSFYGQNSLKDEAGLILSEIGLFTGEDIEGPSGFLIGGTGSYYKVSKYTYLISGGFVPGGTTDINSASNKHIQTPSISGGLFVPHDSYVLDIETIWIRKYAWVGEGYLYIFGPNNTFTDLIANFHSTSYLKRQVPGEITYTGSGALFWAWDDITKKPKNTNFLIRYIPNKKFGSNPTKFTLSSRFKLDDRLLTNVTTNNHLILSSILITDELDFPPHYGYGSVCYLALAGYSKILFYTRGSGYNQLVEWESTSVSFLFNTEYRIVLHYDSTQVIESDRIKVYLNGVLVSPFVEELTFPELGSDGYSNKDVDYDYYYHSIGGSYLNMYGYGEMTQFLGTIYESIFLDDLLKTDAELYSTSYIGPYKTPYSYHLKYTDNLNLGKDYSGNSNNFDSATTVEDVSWITSPYYWSEEVQDYVLYGYSIPDYGNLVVEPVYFGGLTTFSSYLNNNRFTLNFDVYLPSCIRNYLNFDQWSNTYQNPKGSQALRSVTSNYQFTDPTRFTVGCRFLVDSRYEFSDNYNNAASLTLLSIKYISYDETYHNYYDDGSFNIYLTNSEDYDGREIADSAYRGVALHIEGCGNCSVSLPSKFIQANKLYRLVIQVDTNSTLLKDRIKIFLNDTRIDEDNVLIDSSSYVEYPPDSQTYIRVVDYGFPNKGEKLYEYDDRVYATYIGSYISIGSIPISNLYYTSTGYDSFIGTLGEIILVDGYLINSDTLLPTSGYYSGEYGTGLGTFHYKFSSTIATDSGPNNYTLESIGSDLISLTGVNENKNKALFAIQNADGYSKNISQYYRFGFSSSSTGYYLGYEAVGSVTASAFTTTEITPDTLHRIQISVDTTLPVSQDRVKFYLNTNLLSYSGGTHIPQNTNLYSGSGVLYAPYTVIGNLSNYDNSVENKGFTGIFKSPILYIDGLALDAEFFNPLLPPIPYGAYGFKLDFSNVDNLGEDSSPAGNDFYNESVFNVIDYESSYDFSKSLRFIIHRDTTPIQDINLFFKLISAEEVELQLVFNITLDPLVAVLPFKLIGSGIPVELNLPFILTWTSNFDSGTHTNTEIIVTTPNTPIPITYENISGTLITDTTNTIHYEFGTSASDPNSLNGWINQSTGEIVIFDLDTQLNNGVSNVIYEGSNVNVNYDYNLAQSLLIWSMSCSIGQLVGEISVEYEEDASTVAKFTILPESGEIDPLEYIGKSVSLSVTFSDSKGGSYSGSGGKIFTGVVSEVEWDADLRVLNVTADTQMPAYFNSLSREEIDSVVGGIWSNQVWDNEDDSTGWTYAQERLGTTENTIWHDRNGTLRINSFKAGNSSITFTDNERFHETLKLEFAQRSEMVNQIRIDLSYSYPRRREAKTQFKWTDPSNGLIQTFLCGGNSYQLCQRSMVEGAATGGSWVPISQITYDPIWPAQVVQCGGGIYDFIVWGFQLNNIYTPVKTDTGEWQKVNLINLSTGKLNTSTNKMEYQTTPGDPTQSWSQESLVPPEVTNALCIGAKWTAARRWIQSVSEEYEITIQCKDSIDTVGVVASTESYSIDSGIEDDEWENSLTPYKYTPPSGSLSIPGSGDPYWNLDDTSELEDVVTREDFALAQEVIMAAAKTDILKAHRLTTVSFKVPYQSGVDLSQTITVDTPYLSAIGKLRMIKHQFSIDTGEASTELFMAISRHNGNGLYQDDPLEPLERPEPATEEPIDSSIKLGNYVGGRTWGNQGFTGRWEDGRADGEEDPDNEGEWLEEPWEGFMTNYESPLNSNDWNAYMSVPSNLVVEAAWKARLDVASYTIPYQFIVRGPDIDEAHTNASEVQASQVYNVNIPVDYLRISA